jgi:hypothetical protein
MNAAWRRAQHTRPQSWPCLTTSETGTKIGAAGVILVRALHARQAMEVDTERGGAAGEASARSRVWMRGGMSSMDVTPEEDVSQRVTEATSMSALLLELLVM